MGTYDTRGGQPLHDPAADNDLTTDLQDQVLGLLENAGFPASISDRIIALVAEGEATLAGDDPEEP